MNKSVKILSILVIMLIIMLTASNIVMASSTADKVLDEMKKGTVENTSGISKVGGQIVSIITTVAIIISVIVLVVLGIKYMIGSASEKAEYKKTMIPYLVGAVLVFAASALARAIFSIAQQIKF